MNGTLIEPEIMPDGSGRWVVHLEQDGKALCGKDRVVMRTNAPQAANCDRCLSRILPISRVDTTAATVNHVVKLASCPCDHLGSYGVYTRSIGYANVRVYDCHKCGAQLAMDTLPQQLLKRMWGEPKKSEVVENLPSVDLCVTVNGLNALLLSRIFFWSLKRTTYLHGVNLHLINLNISNEEFDTVRALAPDCNSYQRPPTPDGHNFGDAVWSCEWVVENCGREKYVALSHFDIFFVRDFLTYLRKSITSNTGMLGQHCPFMLLNREACARSRLGFQPFGNLYATPFPHQLNQCYLYYLGDPRITENSMQTGFDLGELLELEMRWMGYHCAPMREKFDEHFYHFIGGSRVREGEEFVSLQDRANMFIQEYNIP